MRYRYEVRQNGVRVEIHDTKGDALERAYAVTNSRSLYDRHLARVHAGKDAVEELTRRADACDVLRFQLASAIPAARRTKSLSCVLYCSHDNETIEVRRVAA